MNASWMNLIEKKNKSFPTFFFVHWWKMRTCKLIRLFHNWFWGDWSLLIHHTHTQPQNAKEMKPISEISIFFYFSNFSISNQACKKVFQLWAQNIEDQFQIISLVIVEWNVLFIQSVFEKCCWKWVRYNWSVSHIHHLDLLGIIVTDEIVAAALK